MGSVHGLKWSYFSALSLTFRSILQVILSNCAAVRSGLHCALYTFYFPGPTHSKIYHHSSCGIFFCDVAYNSPRHGSAGTVSVPNAGRRKRREVSALYFVYVLIARPALILNVNAG